MFTYKCFPKATVQLFKKAQAQVEKNLDIRATREVLDVDGSRILCYKFNGQDLFVILDVEVDSVVVKSELEIPNFPYEAKKPCKHIDSSCVEPENVRQPTRAKSGKTPVKVLQLAK